MNEMKKEFFETSFLFANVWYFRYNIAGSPGAVKSLSAQTGPDQFRIFPHIPGQQHCILPNRPLYCSVIPG